MLSFENFNIISFINRNSNCLMDTLHVNIKDVKQIMENQKIRKTKNNIEICTNQLIEEIKNNISIEKIIKECNGNYTIKR